LTSAAEDTRLKPRAFRPSARLRARAQFVGVQQGGRRVSGRFVTLIGLPNTLGADRLGIVASKRVGGAVVRNRAKRRLREIFRREQPSRAGASRSLDVVAIARRELVDAPFAAAEADFIAALGKLRGRGHPS
jgi:ribonuclease P protein component